MLPLIRGNLVLSSTSAKIHVGRLVSLDLEAACVFLMRTSFLWAGLQNSAVGQLGRHEFTGAKFFLDGSL